ncbi:MAG: hypothetical protein ACP5UQ_14740 [Anaerolineae bacterium]
MHPNPTLELLRLLADGGLHSPVELARRLGMSEALISAMAADLARRDYLMPVEQECGVACASCGLKQACRPGPALWTLTPKGRRAAEGAGHELPPTNQSRMHK